MTLQFNFVPTIPRLLEPGWIYISIERRVAMHLCACGCGEQIVTPFSPAEWELIFDGVSVSLSPSIGNWECKCQSHYYITNNEVEWMPSFSKSRIRTVKQKDKKDWERFSKRTTDTKKGAPKKDNEVPSQE